MRALLPHYTPSLQWASAQGFPGISAFNSPQQLFFIWISLLFRQMWKSGIHKFLWQRDSQPNYTLCKMCVSFWRKNSYPQLYLLGTAETSFQPAAHGRSSSRGVAAPTAKLCATAAALLFCLMQHVQKLLCGTAVGSARVSVSTAGSGHFSSLTTVNFRSHWC